MKWPAAERWLQRINALSRRDRAALLLGGLAVLAALEVQMVWPLRQQRVAMQTQQTDANQAQAQAQQASINAMQARLDALRDEWSQRQQSPVHRTRVDAPKALFAELRESLLLAGVQIDALRALPDETHEPLASNDAAAQPEPDESSQPDDEGSTGADQGAATDAAAAPAAKPAPTLYRHRAELRVRGPLGTVATVLAQMEQNHRGLRLERVRLDATETADGQVVATFNFVAISEEPTWLEL